MRSRAIALCVWSILLAAACSGDPEPDAEQHPLLTAREAGSGWELLFDGTSTEGWRSYNGDSMDGWKVSDGVLFTTGDGEDIITESVFSDFELKLEWKIEPGGNSGIFYRVIEDPDARMYESGPEYQIIDDHDYPIELLEEQKTAALADIYPADLQTDQIANQWNHARITVQRDTVQHWFNGELVLEYAFGTPEWEELVEASKFDPEIFGVSSTGHIGLQDHGDPVYYRNIKIRQL